MSNSKVKKLVCEREQHELPSHKRFTAIRSFLEWLVLNLLASERTQLKIEYQPTKFRRISNIHHEDCSGLTGLGSAYCLLSSGRMQMQSSAKEIFWEDANAKCQALSREREMSINFRLLQDFRYMISHSPCR